jgi:tetratricopeptide (TPR) repeat protein
VELVTRVHKDSQDSLALQDHCNSLTNLGTYLNKLGDPREARQHLEGAVHACQTVAQRDHQLVARANWAEALAMLADNRRLLGDLSRAIALRQQAGEIYDRLVPASPQDRTWLSSQAENRIELAAMLGQRGDHAGAERLFAQVTEMKRNPLAANDAEWLRRIDAKISAERGRRAPGK